MTTRSSVELEQLKFLTANKPSTDDPGRNPGQDALTSVIRQPPDGGLAAWTQVAGAFILFMNSWGIVSTFAVYQTYYESGNALGEYSAADFSWIGSFQGMLLICIGVIAGPLYDRGFFLYLNVAGSTLIVLGMMMLSISTSYYSIFLSQGLVVGLGAGTLYVPSVAIVSSYFTTKRALALGCAGSGSAIGGIIYPAIFSQLQPVIGFAWSTRVIAFVALGTLSLAIAIMTPLNRNSKNHPRSYLDMSAFTDIPFLLYTFGVFFVLLGYYVPVFFIPTYADAVLGTGWSLGLYLTAVFNAGSFFGRIIPSFFAGKISPLVIVVPTALATAIVSLCWIQITSLSGFLVFAALYGFLSAICITLPSAACPALSPSMSVIGTRFGMASFPAGIAILVSAPIASACSNLEVGNFLGAQIWTGATYAVAALLLMAPMIHIEKMKRAAVA